MKIGIKNLRYAWLVGLVCRCFFAQAQNMSDFYTEKNHLVDVTVSVLSYGADGTDTAEDSQAFQEAIDAVTQQPNGGVIQVPAGTYYVMDISMKSNVHFEIDHEVIIKPPKRTDTKNYGIFDFDGNNEIIHHVSIRGIDGSFTVDLTGLINTNVRVYSFGNVENFLLSDFKTVDERTKFSTVQMGTSPYNDGYNSPENGVILNGHVDNADYGYGLVQTQAAKNVLFKNLSGTGGVTLRFETGYVKMNELQIGGLFDLVGRNISNENGNAALMVSPHETKNGHIDVDGVTSISSGFAVRLSSGYVRSEMGDITAGYFANTSVIKNVKATFGTQAQLKEKHFLYMPCDLRGSVTEFTNYTGSVKIYQGPSIAAMVNTSIGTEPGHFQVEVTNVTAEGFECQVKAVVTDVDGDENCTGIQKGCPAQKELTILNTGFFSQSFQVYPNPGQDLVSVVAPEGTKIDSVQVFSMIGNRVLSLPVQIPQSILSVDFSQLSRGTYVIQVFADRGKSWSQKIQLTK
ncbi:T9SS type A sorting domain-containing protein [Reichenbachiella carrageenanivorans]|uniref:T9SS type A sorting domain-containing protein n=1 Tax=Reichenbachiella carrageenanivorans TaxID=2979869 RepID=A0ABY6CW22_9BACT|nr:T9SS type A sorting domain-containing protein [Reichenbachiella carrageenanivorans]UXX78111.1 T9SS type A sorting domain-containing protein [Reichenbachiella carrageenanivorans]